jgi:formiminotetrahydrofolate cyclodeaminase
MEGQGGGEAQGVAESPSPPKKKGYQVTYPIVFSVTRVLRLELVDKLVDFVRLLCIPDLHQTATVVNAVLKTYTSNIHVHIHHLIAG